jgi:hypothetical protein
MSIDVLGASARSFCQPSPIPILPRLRAMLILGFIYTPHPHPCEPVPVRYGYGSGFFTRGLPGPFARRYARKGQVYCFSWDFDFVPFNGRSWVIPLTVQSRRPERPNYLAWANACCKGEKARKLFIYFLEKMEVLMELAGTSIIRIPQLSTRICN